MENTLELSREKNQGSLAAIYHYYYFTANKMRRNTCSEKCQGEKRVKKK